MIAQRGFVPPSPEFVREHAAEAAGRRDPAALGPLLVVCERDGLWELAGEVLELFRAAGAVDEPTAERLAADLGAGREQYRRYIERYR
jgi:hypothetical protein